MLLLMLLLWEVDCDGGESAFSDTVVIKVNPGVRTPFALPAFPEALCRKGPINLLRLRVGSSSVTPGAKYEWFHVATNSPVAPPSTDTVLNANAAAMAFIKPGINKFYVIASKNGCSSAASNQIEVRLDTIPNETAFAGPDFIACAGNTIRLNATMPSIGTGEWSLLQGPLGGTLISPSSANTVVDGLQAGSEYTYQWKLSNGACRDYSSDAVKVTVNAFEPPNAGADQQMCSSGQMVSATLSAIRGKNPVGRWSQSSGQTQAGVKIMQPDSFRTTVTDMRPGQIYYFCWKLADVGCGSPCDTVAVRILSSRLYGGPDQPGVCERNACAAMNATPVPRENGEVAFWSVPSGSPLTFERDNPTTSVCNLQPGENIIYWNSNPDVCGSNSRDTVVITYEKSLLRSDTFRVVFGSNITGNVLENDILIKGSKFNGLPNVSSGTLQPLAKEGSFVYTPRATFSGSETIIYQVCSGVCINSCEQASVTFIVGDPGPCFIPTLITPNNDGINDGYIIPSSCFINGEGVETIEVSIYNQWGDLIYHSDNYDNNAPWNGRASGNEELPVGTYFYLVRIGEQAPRKGFIVLQR
jgi:gliding motility-associated-like protein